MLFLLAATLLLAQHSQDAKPDHAAMVMGFDQERTAHHFYLYENGGAIDAIAKDPHDATNRDAIRSHLTHITTMFGGGDFDAPMLVHETKDVPGIAVLSARHASLTYRYLETAGGGRIDITTADREALAALHEFLRYQIREHKTGDSGAVAPRR